MGYSLFWVGEPFDAFFIRKNIFERDSGKYIFNLRYCKDEILNDVHKPILYESPHNCIDYRVFFRVSSIKLANESFDHNYLKYLQKEFKSTFRGKLRFLARLLKSYLNNLPRSIEVL